MDKLYQLVDLFIQFDKFNYNLVNYINLNKHNYMYFISNKLIYFSFKKYYDIQLYLTLFFINQNQYVKLYLLLMILHFYNLLIYLFIYQNKILIYNLNFIAINFILYLLYC